MLFSLALQRIGSGLLYSIYVLCTVRELNKNWGGAMLLCAISTWLCISYVQFCHLVWNEQPKLVQQQIGFHRFADVFILF